MSGKGLAGSGELATMSSTVVGPIEQLGDSAQRHGRRVAAVDAGRTARSDTLSRRGRWAAGTGEVVVALGSAFLAVQLSRSIVVDPLDRIGQVSGVAGLDLRFVVMGLLVLAVCIIAAGFGNDTAWALTRRWACAAVAGLATGLIAGGILLALRGTHWPLFAYGGDSGQLIRWADDLVAGRSIPADYPPVIIHAIARLSELTGASTAAALRVLQVVGIAVFGPIAYLSWRLVFAPTWALAITLVAALPMLEPYKPYTTVVLVVLVPILIAFLGALRRAATMTWPQVAAIGIGTGALLGGLFCVYSGWFVWSAPGALAAAIFVFPWRTALPRGLTILGLAAVSLVAVAAPHLLGLLGAAGTVQDRYFYFDTFADPAYIAMWRNDLPGPAGQWPPPGELAGVGVFTFLLVVGLGLAIGLGGRRTIVVTVGSLMTGAWLMRFWFASQMYGTGSVQLYPRTTAEILFCLLALSVIAAQLATRRARDLVGSRVQLPAPHGCSNGRRATQWSRPGAAATIGALCAALLLALSIGSSVADRYMPRNDNSVGLLAYVAQMVRQPNGRCPDYSAAKNDCAPTPDALLNRGPG